VANIWPGSVQGEFGILCKSYMNTTLLEFVLFGAC
jgi:hypothetical protein